MKTFALTVAVAVCAWNAPAFGATPSQINRHGSDASAVASLRQDMRKLWTDHVVWTRNYIIAAVGDQPDAKAAAGRLLKNQEDIGNAVAGF